jgi:hypothetical protein
MSNIFESEGRSQKSGENTMSQESEDKTSCQIHLPTSIFGLISYINK